MEQVFQGTSFNQDISGWNVSNVINMSSMFRDAASFNQDLSTWDVSKVTNMDNMFTGATAFDQNLGEWDISSLSTAQDMFAGAQLSTTSYDSLLIGWARLDPGETQIPSGITFSGGNSVYCAGESARDSLTMAYSWTITDGGRDCETHWTGDVSSDWFNAGNWTDGVPGVPTTVIIPDVGSNSYPVIGSTGAVCNSLEIQTGAILTVLSTGFLTVEN